VRTVGDLTGMTCQGQEVVEGVLLVQPAGVDGAHEEVTHVRAVGCLGGKAMGSSHDKQQLSRSRIPTPRPAV